LLIAVCVAIVATGPETAKQPLPDVPGTIKQMESVASQPSFELPNHVRIVPTALPRELRATERKVLVAPPFRSEGEAQCDEDGTAFFHVLTGGSTKNPTIFKLGHSQDEHLLYKLPSEILDKKSAFYTAYSVTPAGRLWVLVVEWDGDEPKVAAYGFDSKGAVTSEVHLETPARLLPRHFGAFDNDVFFVEGDVSVTAGTHRTSRPYAAIVNGSGEVTRELHVNLQGLQIQKGRIPRGAAIAGRDGNLNMLLPDQVVVVTQSGETLRSLTFSRPDREALATGISLSGGLIAIHIMEQRKHTLDLTLVLLDANTGDEIGYYRPAEELGNNAICFSRTEGFTFLGVAKGSPDGTLELLTAALR
jgi:hypothetical protein